MKELEDIKMESKSDRVRYFGLDSVYSGQVPMLSFCEQGNEPS
jgi:hypothetical protein